MHRRPLVCALVLGLCAAACGSPQASTTSTGSGGSAGSGGATTTGGSGGSGGSGGATTSATDTTDPRFDALIAAVEAEMVTLKAPGVAVAVIEDGKVTFARGFGSKDPAADVPVMPTTLFRTGSVNKMLTATGMLRQVASGKVDLQKPVTEYVPAFHFAADASWAPSIHVEQLLTHTSGMSDYLVINAPAAQQKDAALESYMTGGFASVDYLMNPPGAFWNYSNPNYYMVGLIGEKTSGKPYRQLMKEDVFTPLGMDRTFFLPSEVLADGDYAIGTTTYPGVKSPVHPDTYENAWARPAGYASSNVLDLAKFVAFLLDGNETVLPKALSDAMQSPQVDTQAFLDLVHYGYGLEITDGVFLGSKDAFYKLKVVEHDGDIPGFAASVTFVPSLRFGFISMASTDNAHFTNSLVTALLTLAKLPAKSPAPDLTPDPSKFAHFEGTYQDDYNAGPITVTQKNGALTVSMPKVDAAGLPYDPVLVQGPGNNNFALSIQGTQLQVTFIDDATGTSRYFRTRVFVGTRPLAPPPPAPALTGERLARFTDALREVRPTTIERLLRP